MLTDRVRRLRLRHEEFLHVPSGRVMHSRADQEAIRRIADDVYSRLPPQPEVLRKAAFLEAFAGHAPVRIAPDEWIVGSQLFNGFGRLPPLTPEANPAPFAGNVGHVIVDYGRVLRLGINGLRVEAEAMPMADERQARNRMAFLQALEAFATFVKRHAAAAQQLAESPSARTGARRRAELLQIAQACEKIGGPPPETFQQALQLTWFVQIFLHAESSSVAISFGRFDQYMWPFLARDLDDSRTTMEQAAEMLACFWLKCCEGDESQNLTVGGTDAHGHLADNPLSVLCLDVTRALGVWQPSVSVRITPGSSEDLWDAALRLCAEGFGMPSFFNDPVVTDSLQAVDIPVDRARDWGIVGCYEACPQGDCAAQTVAGHWVLPAAFATFIQDCGSPPDFASFKHGLREFLTRDYLRCTRDFQRRWDSMCKDQPSPFESLCLSGCTESGLTAEEAGGRFSLFGVNVLGLGTLVDSVHAVKRLVYDTAALQLADLRAQLRNDWPDEALREQSRRLQGKYGTGSPETDFLAAELATLVADLVLGHPLEHGVRPYPGLFIFTGWAQMDVPATPDGRRSGDTLSYGVGPCSFAEGTSPTSVLRSAAGAANDRCGCGNPLLLSVNRSDIRGDAGRLRIRQLVETYFRLGGFHLHFNVTDAAQLREARAHPKDHAGLLVRISGLSAQFVTLDDRLQLGIIERTERGL